MFLIILHEMCEKLKKTVYFSNVTRLNVLYVCMHVGFLEQYSVYIQSNLHNKAQVNK